VITNCRGGLIPTITYDVLEAFWGKRYLVRTAPDIHGIAARDVGMKLVGPLPAAEGVNYRIMYGSKETWQADKNPYDKTMGGITWRGTDRSFGRRLCGLGIPARAARPIYRGNFWWVKRPSNITLGLEYTNQDRGEDPDLELATADGGRETRGAMEPVMAQLHRLFKPSVKGNDIAYIPFDPTAKATNLVAGRGISF
jgi:hypothetical protein